MKVYVDLQTQFDTQFFGNLDETCSNRLVYERAENGHAEKRALMDLGQLADLFRGIVRRNGTINILGRDYKIACKELVIHYRGLRRCSDDNNIEAWGEATDNEWETFISILRDIFPSIVKISLRIPGTVDRFDDKLLTDTRWAQVIRAFNHTGTLREVCLSGMLDDMPHTMQAIEDLSNLTGLAITNDALDITLTYLADVLAPAVTGDLDRDTYKRKRRLGMSGATGMCGITYGFFTAYVCHMLQKHKGTLKYILLEGLVFRNLDKDYFTPLGKSMFPNHRWDPKSRLPTALLPGRRDIESIYEYQEDWLHTSHTTLEEVKANVFVDDQDECMDRIPGAWPVIYAKNNMAITTGRRLSRLLADHFVPIDDDVPIVQNQAAFANALEDLSTDTSMDLERLNAIYALVILEPHNITKSLFILELNGSSTDKKRTFEEMKHVSEDLTNIESTISNLLFKWLQQDRFQNVKAAFKHLIDLLGDCEHQPDNNEATKKHREEAIVLGGVGIIVLLVSEWSNSETILQQAFACLDALFCNNQRKKDASMLFVKSRVGIEEATSLLQHDSIRNVMLTLRAMTSCLRNLDTGTQVLAEAVQLFTAHHGTSSLVKIMDSYPREAQVQRLCCLLLQELVQEKSYCSVRLLVEKGVVNSVSNALKNHMDNPQIKCSASIVMKELFSEDMAN